MKHIYLFSGLGAADRIFKHLDFSGFHMMFVQWVVPFANESIEAYAQRLTQHITTS